MTKRTRLDKAADLIRAALADSPQLARDVDALAAEARISKRTLARAKHQLRVKSEKQHGSGAWVWTMARRECTRQVEPQAATAEAAPVRSEPNSVEARSMWVVDHGRALAPREGAEGGTAGSGGVIHASDVRPRPAVASVVGDLTDDELGELLADQDARLASRATS